MLALLLIALWLVLTAAYVSSACRGTFRAWYEDPIASFAIGTWVACTAVVGTIIQQVFPSWRLPVVALALVSLVLWLWFLALVARGVRAIVADPLRRRVTGTVLLATVSTQSMALLIQVVAPGGWSGWICPPLLVLGCALYGGGLVLILQRYRRQQGWRLAND